jgi:hypothetical protein
MKGWIVYEEGENPLKDRAEWVIYKTKAAAYDDIGVSFGEKTRLMKLSINPTNTKGDIK